MLDSVKKPKTQAKENQVMGHSVDFKGVSETLAQRSPSHTFLEVSKHLLCAGKEPTAVPAKRQWKTTTGFAFIDKRLGKEKTSSIKNHASLGKDCFIENESRDF